MFCITPIVSTIAVQMTRQQTPTELDVVIEIPRGSFLKRGSTERLISFRRALSVNYGSVPQYVAWTAIFWMRWYRTTPCGGRIFA